MVAASQRTRLYSLTQPWLAALITGTLYHGSARVKWRFTLEFPGFTAPCGALLGGGQVWNGDCSGSFSRNEVSDGSELPLMTSLYRGAVSHTWKISHNLYFHILTSSVIYWIRTIFQSNAKKTRNDVYRAATKVLAAWRSRCLCCHYQKFIKHFFFKATLFKTWICFK